MGEWGKVKNVQQKVLLLYSTMWPLPPQKLDPGPPLMSEKTIFHFIHSSASGKSYVFGPGGGGGTCLRLAPTCTQGWALKFKYIRYVNFNVKTMFNPRSLEEKIITRSLEGGGGSIGPPPSTFNTIHPIDIKLGTNNKLHLYFQLSETTWRLIGFHGNIRQINGVTGGRHLGFLNFQILFKFSLLYFKTTRKLHLAVEIPQMVRIHCEEL